MKLAYERPVMRAELFQTNAYCAGCTIGSSGTGAAMNKVKLGDSTMWFHVPSSGTNWNNWESTSVDSTYAELTFGGVQREMTGSWGASQYYWTTSVGDKTYHLEYSAGWTDRWDGGTWQGGTNPDYQTGDKVFVLYEEDTGNKDLEANVNGYFPGSQYDDDEERFDNAIYSFIFRDSQIQAYWST